MNIYLVDKEKKYVYLETIKLKNEEKTVELYSKVIDKLDEFENYKGIQATNMTKLDFMEFLTSLNSSSLNVLYTYKSAINSYLIFATDKRHFTIGLLELEKITQNDLLECINQKTESIQFITESEYYDIITKVDEKTGESVGNYQDKLVIILLWNKIKGKNQFSDLLDLKVSDVNFQNKTIKNKNKIIQLSDIEFDIVEKAIEEPFYVRRTMDKKGFINKALVEYLGGNYLVKATAGSTNLEVDDNQCTYGTFANRMSKYYNIVLQRSGLTNQRVYKSSVYYYMLLEYGRKLSLGELTDYLKERGEKVSLSNMYREQDIMFAKMEEQGVL